MSLRLIYGRAGSGKSTYCFNRIKETMDKITVYHNKEKYGVLILLVPEQVSFQTEKNLVKRIGVTGVEDVNVFSFKRLAYTVFKEVGGITREHMDCSGKCMLIYRIMEQLRDELKVFSTASRQQGFVDTISDMISEFKRYNVTPDILNQIKEKVGNNSLLFNKISDLSLIFKKFEEILHKGYIDSDDDLTILYDKLDECTVINGAEIWIDEFNGFTPQQYLIIEKLFKKAKRVNITLNMNYDDKGDNFDDSDIFSPIRYTERTLMKIAEDTGTSIEKPVILNNTTLSRFNESDELFYLEENYFKYPFKPYRKDTEKIKIFKAENVYSEIENAAADILRLCRDENIRFKDIGVITRDLDNYEKIIKAVFTEYNIPYFIDSKKDITTNPLIVLIISAIEVFNRNWSYEAVFRYLKTGLLTIDKEDVDLLENYIMESGIKGKKRWTNDEVWYDKLISIFNIKDKIIEAYGEEASTDMFYKESIIKMIEDDGIIFEKEKQMEEVIRFNKEEDEIEWEYAEYDYIGDELSENDKVDELNSTIEKMKRISRARKETVKYLLNFHNKVKGRKTTRVICAELFEFLCEIHIPETIEEWINKFKDIGNQGLVNEYGQIWNVIINLLDQMVEVLGDERLSLEEFVKVLGMGFSQHKMGFIPSALDQVTVSSIERIKSHELKYLYLIGVNDGIFPSAFNDEGILTDLDRESLRSEGLELALDTKAQAFEEQFLVYTALTLSGQYLRVSYPIADHEGKTLRPSIIISRLKALFPNIKEKSNVVIIEDEEENIELVTSPIPTFNALISLLQKEIEREKISTVWEETYNWFKSNEMWSDKLYKILQGFSYTNQVESLNKDKIKLLYGDKKCFSVSKIEKYIECPFSYFVRYGLRAKERKIFNLSAPDLGSFMHNVIDKFSKTVDKEGLNWGELDKEWCTKTVSEKVEESIKETSGNVFRSSPRYRYFAERLKRVLTRTALLIVEHMKRSGFEPMGYEIEFGFDKEGYPPIEIELSTGEKVKLLGKIDRADKLILGDEEYFRIIDYKSGNKEFKLSDVYYGLQIQLLTYLDAVLNNESNLETLPIFPAGILYFKIDDPIIKSKGRLSDEEIEKEIMKKLKMNGLVLSDTEIIRKMDNKIEGASLIIPAQLKKDGSISVRSHAATKEQFENLRIYVRNKLTKACEQMLDGDIEIRPYKKKQAAPCTYCMYSPICQFDPLMKDNNYKVIDDKKDEEVWELIYRENQNDRGK